MSALPPKADMDRRGRHVRFVPKADICSAAKAGLFDHLVGDGKWRRRNKLSAWPPRPSQPPAERGSLLSSRAMTASAVRSPFCQAPPTVPQKV